MDLSLSIHLQHCAGLHFRIAQLMLECVHQSCTVLRKEIYSRDSHSTVCVFGLHWTSYSKKHSNQIFKSYMITRITIFLIPIYFYSIRRDIYAAPESTVPGYCTFYAVNSRHTSLGQILLLHFQLDAAILLIVSLYNFTLRVPMLCLMPQTMALSCLPVCSVQHSHCTALHYWTALQCTTLY